MNHHIYLGRITERFEEEKQWIFIRFVGTHEAYNKLM
jgi:mRNA-degrading endonuclease HigB of HigAB toxin-antitoxin module